MKIIITVTVTMAFWSDDAVTHAVIPALDVVTSHVSEQAALSAARVLAEDTLHRAYNEDRALFSQLEARGYEYVAPSHIEIEYRELRRVVRETHGVAADTTIYLMDQTINLHLEKRG